MQGCVKSDFLNIKLESGHVVAAEGILHGSIDCTLAPSPDSEERLVGDILVSIVVGPGESELESPLQLAAAQNLANRRLRCRNRLGLLESSLWREN